MGPRALSFPRALDLVLIDVARLWVIDTSLSHRLFPSIEALLRSVLCIYLLLGIHRYLWCLRPLAWEILLVPQVLETQNWRLEGLLQRGMVGLLLQPKLLGVTLTMMTMSITSLCPMGINEALIMVTHLLCGGFSFPPWTRR